MSRSVLMAGASVVLAVSNCGTYGQCPIEVDLDSPCGFLLIETTCSSGLPTCTMKDTLGRFTSCVVSKPDGNCSIAVMLGDGTQQTIPVTVDRCVSPGFVYFGSPTCTAPPSADAGLDTQDATGDSSATDAISDATND